MLVQFCMWFDVGHQMAVSRPWRVVLRRSSFCLYASPLAGLVDRSVLRVLEGVQMIGFSSAGSCGHMSYGCNELKDSFGLLRIPHTMYHPGGDIFS